MNSVFFQCDHDKIPQNYTELDSHCKKESLDETAARSYAMGIVFCLRSWTIDKAQQCARF